jgi:hypothetical protein
MKQFFRVYVAGRYSGNTIDFLNNMVRGQKESVKLLKLGFIPFCPFLDYQFQFHDQSLVVDDYYRYSIGWLEVCDAVYVLPDSEESQGTQREIKIAQDFGIPVVYNLNDLRKLC